MTDGRSGPLHSSWIGQDGPRSAYHYVAGLTAQEVNEVRVEFTDGSTDITQTIGGTFFVLFPNTKMIAFLRPIVPAFPDLRCTVVLLEGAGGYTDGVCLGYTFRLTIPR